MSEIEDAKVISETENSEPEIDLVAQLKKTVTEKKFPGASAIKKEVKSFWDVSDDDFERPSKSEATKESKESEKAETEPETEKVKGKLTAEEIDGSASAAAGLTGVVTRTILTGIVTFKQRKKLERSFTEDELEAIELKLLDTELEKLNEKEKVVRNRFDRLMKRYEEKMDKVQFSEKDEKELKKSFAAYSEYTNTTMSPKWYVFAELADKIGNRIMDALED